MPALDLSTWASGEVTWQEIHTLLHDQLKLPDLKLPGVTDKDKFPLLPHKDAKVDVRLEFFFSGGSDLGFQLEDGSGKVGFCIEVDINLGEDRSLFGVMTLGRKGCFRFSTCFESVGSLNAVLSGQSGFSGTATIEVFTCLKLDLLKLLPQNENLLTVDVGDAEGWIPVRFFATFEAEKAHVDRVGSVREEQANLNISLELEMEIGQKTVDDTVLSIGVQFPGLVQAEPPLQMGVTYIKSHFGLELENTENAQTETQVEFSLETHGYFHFRFPELKPEMKPILAHLEELPVFIEGVQGNLLDLSIPIVAELAINIENTDSIAIALRIQEPSIEIDVFSMLAKLAIGLPEPESQSGNKAIPLNTDIGFNFKGVALCLGRQGATTNAEQFALEMVLGAKFGELAIDGFFKISDRELKIGLKRMEIPITMPLFPLSTNDFEESYIDRQDNSRKAGAYHIIDAINIPIDPAKPVGLQKAQEAILATTALVQAEIDALSGSDVGARRDRLYAKLALMTQIFTLRGSLKNWNDSTFKLWLKTFVGAIERLTSPLQSNGEGFSLVYTNEGQQHTLFRNLSLVLEDLILQIPFRDPRNLGIQGTAHFSGFEEPFDALNKIRLSAGISATMIYFQFDAAGATIPFPDLGTPYKGGSLTIGEFRFGLGYTTRTFAFALAGELVLPEPLVDDLDTSDLIGVGVRLPVQSALNFRLDLLPIPVPKAVIIIPLFEFNIDLRKDYSPGITATEVCTPYWDGLQLIIKDVCRFAFKQISYSIFFGPLPAPNARYNYDESIGDRHNGYTFVTDELLMISGLIVGSGGTTLLVQVPPLFSTYTPFVNNYCVNLRFAGFSLNFDLQRPLPRFSPFALFELFALLCDPVNYKVNPNGELANTLRATLRDAYIILPPNVRRLFPKIADRINKPLEITINLATYIQIAQLVMQFITPVMENLFDTAIATATPALRELQEGLKRLDNLTPTNLGIASFNYRILLEVAKISRQIIANNRVASASSVAEFKQKFIAEIERLKTVSNAIAHPEPLTRELLLEAVQSVSSKIWEGDLLVNITDIQEFRRRFAATITQLEEPSIENF